MATITNSCRRPSGAIPDVTSKNSRHGDHYELVSPLAGLIVEINAPIGSARGPADGPVMKISGGSSSRIEARFAFTLPTDAEYRAIDGAGTTYELHLVAQAPDVMPQDATRLAWFEAPAPIPLPHGTAVGVRMLPPRGAWVVPATALVREQAHLGVRTRRGKLVAVDPIATLGGEVLLLGPLQADDLVAEEGSATRD
jgi:hypothetical protein